MSKRAENTDIARRAQDKGPVLTGDWLRRLRRCLSPVILSDYGAEVSEGNDTLDAAVTDRG
jgi:hypothetical protein